VAKQIIAKQELAHTSSPGEKAQYQGEGWGCLYDSTFQHRASRSNPTTLLSSKSLPHRLTLHRSWTRAAVTLTLLRHGVTALWEALPKTVSSPQGTFFHLRVTSRLWRHWGNSTTSQQGGVGSSLHPEAEENKGITDTNLFLPTEGFCLVTWLRVTKQDI